MLSSPVRAPLGDLNVNIMYPLRSTGLEASEIKKDASTMQTTTEMAAAVQPDKPGAYRTNHKLAPPTPPPSCQAESLLQDQIFDFVPPLTHPRKTRRLWKRVMANQPGRIIMTRNQTLLANAASDDSSSDNTPVSELTIRTTPQDPTPPSSVGPSESASLPKHNADPDTAQLPEPLEGSEKNLVPSDSFPQETSSDHTGHPDDGSAISQATNTTSKNAQKDVRDARQIRKQKLESRNIVIGGNEMFSSRPFKHFGTDEDKPPLPTATVEARLLHYTRLPGLEYTTAWLSLTEEQSQAIKKEYMACKEMGANEALYAVISGKVLLREPLQTLDDLDNSTEKRGWRSIVACELAPPKEAPPKEKDTTSSESLWKLPPVFIPQANSTFIEYKPDRCFYLDFPGFNQEYSNLVLKNVMVVSGRMTCPYLTVEFKKDNASDIRAQNQVAGFGARALYNRWLLRKRRCNKSDDNWTTERRKQSILHYGLTLSADTFTFWCLQPTIGSIDEKKHEWKGCSMQEMASDSLARLQGVRRFAEFINEIHRWGLTKHAQSCEDDIKIIVRSQDTDTSELGERPS